jgi:hypothetical protein
MTEQNATPNTLATLPAQPGATTVTVPTWGQAEHLSPLSVFQPDRVDVCAYYQLGRVTETTAASHLAAAVQHLRAAVDNSGKEDKQRISNETELLKAELNRLYMRLG